MDSNMKRLARFTHSPPQDLEEIKKGKQVLGSNMKRLACFTHSPPQDLGEIKKGKQAFTFFCPKSTMNLTYLCYGMRQMYRNN